MGIDKGNTTADVLLFDELYGIEYPGVSGQDGGGNAVHWDYNIQATPTIVVITPDKLIASKQIYPPNTENLVDSITNAGGILQSCTTSIPWTKRKKNLLTLGPNPTSGFTTINFSTDELRTFEIDVVNASGNHVHTIDKKEYSPGSYSIPLDLSSSPEGFYFVTLKENNGFVVTSKLVLKN